MQVKAKLTVWLGTCDLSMRSERDQVELRQCLNIARRHNVLGQAADELVAIQPMEPLSYTEKSVNANQGVRKRH